MPAESRQHLYGLPPCCGDLAMPKRKAPCSSDTQLSVSSLDAAFDILASETFSKLDHLVKKFEAATHTRLNDGVAHGRWDEACKRYWVTKAMEDLCCSGKPTASLSDMAEAMDSEYDQDYSAETQPMMKGDPCLPRSTPARQTGTNCPQVKRWSGASGHRK